MAERPSRKKLTVNELILKKLKETFDQNENVTDDSGGTNVWVMLAAAEPLSNLLDENLPYPLTNRKPTHRVRVVLRTTDAQTGTNPYVDGSDFFLAVDEQQQTAYKSMPRKELRKKTCPYLWYGSPRLIFNPSTSIMRII